MKMTGCALALALLACLQVATAQDGNATATPILIPVAAPPAAPESSAQVEQPGQPGQAPVVEHTPVAVPLPLMPKVPPTHSVAEADAKLADVKARRAALEAKYIDDERDCYDKFFANMCIDKIKEVRRTDLAGLRAIEVEASHFKRADAVDKRDAALVEQDRKFEADAALRAAAPAKTPSTPPKEAVPDALTPAQRQAQYAAKVKEQQAKDAAAAAQRAANAEAFAKKQVSSAQHEKDLEAKQADKAAKLRKKQADDAAAAAADAAAAAAAAAKK
jgi:colicin import membrane protein